jgi:hypothetical protein
MIKVGFWSGGWGGIRSALGSLALVDGTQSVEEGSAFLFILDGVFSLADPLATASIKLLLYDITRGRGSKAISDACSSPVSDRVCVAALLVLLAIEPGLADKVLLNGVL